MPPHNQFVRQWNTLSLIEAHHCGITTESLEDKRDVGSESNLAQ